MSIPSGNRAGKKQLEVWPTSLFLFRQNAHRKGNRYIVKKEKRTTILRFYSFTKDCVTILCWRCSPWRSRLRRVHDTADHPRDGRLRHQRLPVQPPFVFGNTDRKHGGRDFLRQNLILCAWRRFCSRCSRAFPRTFRA